MTIETAFASIQSLDTESLKEAAKKVETGAIFDAIFDELEERLSSSEFVAFCNSL